MKISTNQATHISSPSCMVKPNKNIPKTAGTPASKEGRQIKFEPIVIFTPIMTSNRTKRDSPEKRPPRLSEDQMDDVCNFFGSLFTNEGVNNDDETDSFARFAQSIASSDKSSSATITVRRSARLAACKNEQHPRDL